MVVARRVLPAVPSTATRRRAGASRKLRSFRGLLRAVTDRHHPVLAHLVPIRRCNLACAYCNEFDKTSGPVPASQLLASIGHLRRLGTSVVAFSGGEPLLHPDLDALIHRVRESGMLAGLITNGYRLSPGRITALNAAGLDFLQISIDNVAPDDVSRKSLRVLDRKLRWLRDYATFDVNINSVVGSGVARPGDAAVIADRARALGFSTSIGIIHDGSGRLKPLDAEEREVFQRVSRARHPAARFFQNMYSSVDAFQTNLVDGAPNNWRCRAGARYLYVDEAGIVSYCSQQRGRPGIPLERYTVDDVRREFATVKPCAPMCTVGCVHRVAALDKLRLRPRQQDA